MLINYISQKLSQARYKILEDGSYFGEIPELQGVWASEKTLEKCRDTLQEVLEEWIVLKLHDGNVILDFPKNCDIKEIIKEFKKTKLYNQKFLDSLKQGLKRSSFSTIKI